MTVPEPVASGVDQARAEAANHGQKRSRGAAVRSASVMISMPVVSTPRRRTSWADPVSVLMA